MWVSAPVVVPLFIYNHFNASSVQSDGGLCDYTHYNQAYLRTFISGVFKCLKVKNESQKAIKLM